MVPKNLQADTKKDRDNLEQLNSTSCHKTRTRSIFATQGEKTAMSEAPKCYETRCAPELWLRYVEKLNCVASRVSIQGKFKKIQGTFWQGRT